MIEKDLMQIKNKKEMKKLLFPFLIIFIILLPISYLGVSIVKQNMFEYNLDRMIPYYEAEILSYNRSLNEKLLMLDKNDKEVISYFFRDKAYTTSLYYYLETDKIIKKQSYANIFYRLIEIYGFEYIEDKEFFIIYHSYQLSNNYFNFEKKDNCIDKLCIYLDEWKKVEDFSEEDWWSNFEKSNYYKEFLKETFNEIENKKEYTLYEIYNEVINYNQSYAESFNKNKSNEYFISIHEQLVEFAYQNYIKHKEEGNFVAATVDSNIIYTIWKYLKDFKGISIFDILNFMIQTYPLKIILDLILIITITTIFDLFLLYMLRYKMIKNHN